MNQTSEEVHAIGKSLTACLFEFVELVSTWSIGEDELDKKVTELLVDAADQLETVQFGVDVTTATGNGIGVLSGLAGVVGFGLLFNPITLLPGIITLAVSGGTGGIGLVTELSARIHNWRTGKETLNNVEEELCRLAGIDYNTLNAFAKKLLAIIAELNVEMKKTNDMINEEVATLCVITFFHDALSFFSGDVKAINESWIEYYEDLTEKWNLKEYDEVSKFYNDQYMSSVDKLEKEGNCEMVNAVNNENLIMNLSSTPKIVDYATNLATAAKSSEYFTTVSAVAQTFEGLSKGTKVISSLGVAFSILSIPLGGYGMYSSITNITQNAKENRSLNQESLMIRFNAALIQLGIQLRNIY